MPATLQRQSTIAFLLAAVIPLAFACVGLSLWFHARLADDARQRIGQAAEETAARLDLFLGRHLAAVEALARRLDEGGAAAGGPRTSEALLRVLGEHPGFLSLQLADPSGNVVAAVPAHRADAALARGVNIADRDYFRAARDVDGLFLSEGMRGRGFGADPIVAISHAFAWEGGERGVVGGSLDLEVLRRAVLAPGSADTLTRMIVDGSGRLVAGDGRQFRALDPVPPSFLAGIPRGPRLAAQSLSQEAGWRVVGIIDRQALYRPVGFFVGALLATLCAVTLLASWIFRRYSSPVLGWLAGVSRELARRKLEDIVVPRLPPSAPVELEALDGSLNRVLSTVRNQHERLREHLVRLEERVEARTVEVRERNRELQHHRSVLEQFVKQAPVAIAMLDREMRFRAVSDRWIAEFGLDSDQLIERAFTHVFPEQASRWKDRHDRCLRGATLQADEEPLPRRDGSLDWLRWEMHPWRGAEGEILGTVMMSEIVTEKKQLKDQLRHLADHDALTGLPNRRAFVDMLRRTLSRAESLEYAVLFVDLDDFKAVNDRHGHLVGDHVLRTLAQRLRDQARAGDLAARLGGDEFVVLSRLSASSDLKGQIRRYGRLLGATVPCEGRDLEVSVSVGGTVLAPDLSVEEILERADSAMYHAKRSRGPSAAGMGDP